MEAGSIIIANKKGKDAGILLRVFCALQRFFTKKEFTHCALSAFYYDGNMICFSIEELATLRYLNDYMSLKYSDVFIYKVNIDKEKRKKYVCRQVKKNLGQSYGYAQLLWFVYRWFFEAFTVDVRSESNWFTNGKICSESVYNYLQDVANDYPELKDDLSIYNENTCNVGDIVDIMKKHDNIFVKVYESNNK